MEFSLLNCGKVNINIKSLIRVVFLYTKRRELPIKMKFFIKRGILMQRANYFSYAEFSKPGQAVGVGWWTSTNPRQSAQARVN